MKISRSTRKGQNQAERGTVLVVVTVAVASLATLSLTMVTRTQATYKEARSIRELQAARYVAEAGLNAAYVDMKTGGTGAIGSEQNPVSFGGGEYWVESVDMGGDVYSLSALGSSQGGGIRSELVLHEVIETKQIYGVFGDEWLTMDSNAFVDSYDSTTGTYISQAINKVGNDVWANSKGHTGSNGNISLSQNSGVHGDATPGVGAVTTTAGFSEVSGSTLPIAEPYVFGEIVVPVGVSTGDLLVTGDTILPSGTYFLDTLQVGTGDKLVITGPAVVVVDTLELLSHSKLLVDSTDGGVEFYVMENFLLNSNVLFAPKSGDPADLAVSILADNIQDPDLTVELDPYDPDAEISLFSNSVMYGTLQAPNALIDIASNFELHGSLSAQRLSLSANSMVHFDEHLAVSDEEKEIIFEVVGWIEVPVHD